MLYTQTVEKLQALRLEGMVVRGGEDM